MTPHKKRAMPHHDAHPAWGVFEAAWQVSVHLFGVVGVALLTGLVLAEGEAMRALLQHGSALGPELMSEVVWHVLMSALLWGALVVGYHLLRAQPRARRALKLARGQVMLETLIVITPFLLLTGGLSQLMINNIAGMLSHLSAFQAGRTYWVWYHESQRDPISGGSVAAEESCKRARLAAAASLAPVAGGPLSGANGGLSLNNLNGIMVAHFADQPVPATGSSLASSTAVYKEVYSYKDAFDTSGFSKRATLKLRAAYANTTVMCDDSGPQLKVTVTYKHFLAFPWFSYIFEDDPGYSTFVRSFQLPKQAPPK